MSDTPISDSTPHNVADLGMLCRRLERELNAANAEIEEKRKDVVWLETEKAELEERIKRLEEENNELRANEARSLNTNGELERRIERLEEAGNELYDGWRSQRNNMDKYLEAWNKAKEANCEC